MGELTLALPCKSEQNARKSASLACHPERSRGTATIEELREIGALFFLRCVKTIVVIDFDKPRLGLLESNAHAMGLTMKNRQEL
jgi:hypothetical protein